MPGSDSASLEHMFPVREVDAAVMKATFDPHPSLHATVLRIKTVCVSQVSWWCFTPFFCVLVEPSCLYSSNL